MGPDGPVGSVPCPDPECPGVVQPAVREEGLRQPPTCNVCRTPFPDPDGPSPEEAQPWDKPRRGRPEQRVRIRAKRGLQTLGYAVWDLEQNRPTRQDPGPADLFVCGHGVTAWLECKAGKNTLTDHQRRFRELVEENGGTYRVVRGTDDVVAFHERITGEAVE